MQNALRKLGIVPDKDLSLEVILGESFNGSLYGLSGEQMERISALREIVASYEKTSGRKVEQIRNSADAAAAVYHQMKNMGHEEVVTLFLNSNNEIIHRESIFKGSTSEVNISPRDIVSKALCVNATGLILVHNHPSGNPLPSTADIRQTEALKNACETLGLALLDHIIISKGKYYSFSDEETSKIS